MRIIAFLCFVFLFVSTAYAATDQRGVVVRPKAPTGGEAKGDLWLLTIGINSYLSWPQLKTAINDARAVKDVLLKRYHLDSSHVVELTDDKATRHNILGAFRDLTKKVKPEDSLLVYYAGHGYIDPITGKGSWIPVESGTDDPTSWIDNRNITDYLNVNAIKAKHVLMVSDSCFSGDFFRGSRGALPTIDDVFLKKAYQRSSRQAISSGGLEPVSDAGFGGNSVFSHFLVAALNNNNKEYLIPSEIFGEIKAGVGRNADQLPQYGDLHGVGGQDGGELILFLKQENRMNDLSAGSAVRQKELEQLRKMEREAAKVKQNEQAELAKKQAELEVLDKQISDMKIRLGSGSTRSNDSLDAVVAMVEQKEQQAQRLEELRIQREAEEQNRQQEILRLRQAAIVKRLDQVKADLAKYRKVASSKYGQDMKDIAWDALVSSYPEAKVVPRFDEIAFMDKMGEFAFINPQNGLTWPINVYVAKKPMSWNTAMEWVKELNYGGYNDWRLPTKDELVFVADYVRKSNDTNFSTWPDSYLGEAKKDLPERRSWYWSATERDNDRAWTVNMIKGDVYYNIKSSDSYVLPVRNAR